MHAAKSIGCSHVLIYNAIAGKVCDHACGWKLKWVDRKDVSFIAVEGAEADWLKMQGKTSKAVIKQITEKVTAMIREVKVKKWKEILEMENLTAAERRELKKKTTAELNADKEQFIKNEIELALSLNKEEK